MIVNVLIVGAGIAGHTLACALAKAGISFDIVEKKESWEILGAGMYVQNNALRGFAEIGIAEQIIAAGWTHGNGVSDFLDLDGNLVAHTVLPKDRLHGFPGYVPIARPRLHEILTEAFSKTGAVIRMGTTVIEIDDQGDQVAVRFSDGGRGRYDLIVGADGINSSVRDMCFDGVSPSFTGFSNWRVILPMDPIRDRVTWQIGNEKSLGVIPISNDQLYIAGVTKEPENPWFEPDTLLDLMLERFAEFGGPARDLLDQVSDPSQVVYTPINEVIMPLPWRAGRVVLVGDAAHASTPFWAQGASMAIEDVILLSRLLAEGGEIGATLSSWQARRYPRCAYVQEGSKATGVRGHAPGQAAMEQAQAHMRAHAQQDVEARFARLSEPI